jgi:hypothetical protein
VLVKEAPPSETKEPYESYLNRWAFLLFRVYPGKKN